jgi:hypothetical protein
METLIGFAIGYLIGTRQGQDGLRKVRDSVEAIRNSPEVRQMLVGGASVAGSMAQQMLGGGAGAVLGGVVETLARKATDAMSGTEDRKAA